MRTAVMATTLVVGSVSLTMAQAPIPVGDEFQVNSYTTGYQIFPDVAKTAPGDFIVVWDSPHDGDSWGVFGQRYDRFAATVGGEFQINTFTTGGQGSGGDSSSAVAVADGGQFVVVWEDFRQIDFRAAIFGQLYDSSGSQVGGEFRVNTAPYASENHPDVGMASSGGFVVVWESYDDGSGSGIAGQQFSSTGVKIGEEFEVNSTTGNIQEFATIAMRDSGYFVVVWESLVQDGSSDAVVARLFDPAANPIGDDFVVNSYTTDTQQRPDVSITDSGDFVVVWDSLNQDGSSNGIFGQRLNSGGVKVGAEFQVNAYTTGGQFRPAVAITPWNEFLVTWESSNQDGDSLGIFAQAYDGAGVRMGDEFMVNTVTQFRQRSPSVAVGDGGDFIVAFSDNFQEAILNEGVRGRRFVSSSAIFADGFESGNTSGWSSAVP